MRRRRSIQEAKKLALQKTPSKFGKSVGAGDGDAETGQFGALECQSFAVPSQTEAPTSDPMLGCDSEVVVVSIPP